MYTLGNFKEIHISSRLEYPRTIITGEYHLILKYKLLILIILQNSFFSYHYEVNIPSK